MSEPAAVCFICAAVGGCITPDECGPTNGRPRDVSRGIVATHRNEAADMNLIQATTDTMKDEAAAQAITTGSRGRCERTINGLRVVVQARTGSRPTPEFHWRVDGRVVAAAKLAAALAHAEAQA